MNQTRRDQLNYLFEQIDRIYRQYGSQLDVSDSAMSVYYGLLDQGGGCELSLLRQKTLLPKQTLNSLLRTLQKEGHVEVSLVPGSKKSKQAVLTKAGLREAERTAGVLMEYEQKALDAFDPQQVQQMLSLVSRYCDQMEMLLEQLKNNGKEKKKNE